MTANARKTRLVHAFLRQICEIPYDLFVPKYERWVGLQPTEQEHYLVVYHDCADGLLRRVAVQDQSLYPLQRRLNFCLDEKNRRLHVHLIPLAGVFPLSKLPRRVKSKRHHLAQKE